MSLSDVVASIKADIKKIVASKRLNKNEFSSQAKELAELASHRARFSDGSVVDKIVAAMPESDFCKIAEVKDCMVGPSQACTCVKVMVFGNDDVNGKICEKFTVNVVETSCNDGNLALGGKCAATSVSDSCDAILITANSARTLEARLVEMGNKLAAIESKLTVIDHKLDQVPIISTVVQEHGNSIDAGIDEDKSLRKKIFELSDRLDSYERLNKFVCSAFDPASLQGQAQDLYGLLCTAHNHDEL